ncbi:LysR family transcriptional regulator [Amycolatopsis nigrescens]|uniref:LysR family transcriptional regulator n=1 Tax=Amycolatopsis nigrescens TaxID=381445 RepID=UPI00036DCFC0|nr:LysR family transcriptional regulator [Amycolatopsis nigrescens]
MQLELRHLRTVCAIADAGSVSKAAAVLGLAQPALTAQLQRIEAALGGTLFDRDRRGARPTPLGELVLNRARVLLPAVQELQYDAIRLADNGSELQRFRIAAVSVPFLAGLVRRLEDAYPGALVTTTVSWSAAELAELVSARRGDFTIAGVCGDAPPPAVPGLAWTPIATGPVFVLLSAEHPCARLPEVRLEQLSDMRWAVTPGDGCFADCFAAACARAGFTPAGMYEVDTASCLDLAQSGDAAALCQATMREAPGLVAVPIAGAPLSWRHLLGWLPRTAAAEFAEQVADLAGEAYAAVIARNSRYPEWLATHPHFGAHRPHAPLPV